MHPLGLKLRAVPTFDAMGISLEDDVNKQRTQDKKNIAHVIDAGADELGATTIKNDRSEEIEREADHRFRNISFIPKVGR